MKDSPNPIDARALIDRGIERAFLADRWIDATNGRGSLVLIEGDAGIGKSRLIEEFTRDVDGFVVAAACLPYAAAPFAVVADALRAIVGTHPDAAPLAPYLRSALRTIVPEIGPPLESIDADGALVRRWMLDGATQMLARLSSLTPALLVVEDLQWADTDSLAALSLAATRLGSVRIVLIGSYRLEPEQSSEGFNDFLGTVAREPTTNRIVLDELDKDEALRLIAASTPRGSRLPEIGVQRVYRRAGGNPLFIKELVRQTVEAGPDAARLPRELERLFEKRFAAFAPAERAILARAAAHWGSFAAIDVSSSLNLELGAVKATLVRACRYNLLRELADGPQRFAFKNQLEREFAYALLDSGEAAATHEALARYAEASGGDLVDLADLAHHWYLARDENRALRYGLLAGDALLQAHALERAVETYARLVPLAHELEVKAEIHEKLGRLYGASGDTEEALNHFETASCMYEELGASDELARTRLAMSSMRAREWSERSLHDAESALAAAGGSAANTWGFGARVQLARTLFLRHDVAGAREQIDAAAPHARTAGSRNAALFENVRAWLAFHDGDPRCSAMALDAVASARVNDDAHDVAMLCTDAADIALERGEAVTAAAHYAAAIEAARRAGNKPAAAFATISYAAFLCEYGSLAEAGAVLGVLGAPPLESRWLTAAAASVGLRIALAAGDCAMAELWIEPAYLDYSRKSADVTLFGPHAAAHATNAARMGDTDRALQLLTGALASMHDAHGNHATLISVAELGFAQRLPRAREILATTAARWNVPRTQAYLELYDALAAQPGRDRAGHARRAIVLFNAIGIGMPAARAYEAAGDLPAAASLYARYGAGYHYALVAGDDNAPEALTKREYEIAALIAQGLANKEIASKLELSNRTVENHVAAILRKLKLRSRTEVATTVLSATRKSV